MKPNTYLLIMIATFILSGCLSNDENSRNFITQNDTIPQCSTPTYTPTIINYPTVDPTKEWINQEVDYGIEQGNKIIKAIENYYQDHGIYPNKLSKLIPEYIDEIPKTISGQEYHYKVFEPYIYTLTFERNRTQLGQGKYINYCTYLRNNNEWECAAYQK